ncbi:MAG TPA: hypothetical protein VIK91_22030 [Nannocystis sp.]
MRVFAPRKLFGPTVRRPPRPTGPPPPNLPLCELPGGGQILNVDARVVLLERAA